MRAQEFIVEAFNQPYAVDLSDESEHGDYDSLVQLPDGSYLTVMFNNQGNDEYQVEFWRGPSQGVTGEGDAQRIFATVLNTIQKFIKEHNPWRLTFSATKDVEPGQNSESRAKLYNRLVDRYARTWGYDALINDLGDQVEYELTRLKPGVTEDVMRGVAEGFPQPGPSSGAPKQFGSDAKIQTRQMTVKDIISSVPEVPYYNNVVDDWDAKDYSWGVTKKVIEYATYLKDHPESLAKLPPAIVLNGKFEDGAHRVSAIWLLQQRMDPKNPLWKNAKLNVQFVKPGVAEDAMRGVIYTKPNLEHEWPEANRYPEFHKLGKDQWIKIARQGSMAKWSSLKDVGNFDSDLSNLEPEKRKRAAVLVNRGKVELPIVGRWSNGELDLIAGNTRTATLLDQGHDPKVWVVDVPDVDIKENFADGKKPGRKGLAKRSGVNTKASVSSLRKTAKNSSGEKQRMAHWLANMKAGRAKKK